MSRSSRITSPSLTPARPTPHSSIRAAAWALGLLGRDVVATEGLGVDDDLGLGLGLDRVDDLLGLSLGRRRQDLGVVVDGLAVDRFGEGRSRGGRRCGEGDAARAGPAARATSHRTAAMRETARRDRCMALIVRHRSRTCPPDETEAPVGLEEDLRRARTAVVGRGERGGVGPGIGDRDEVAAAKWREVVRAEGVGRFADRAVDARRFEGEVIVGLDRRGPRW